MKKMKLFLLAAMVIGMGSAFTTVKPTDELWVNNKQGDGFITESDAKLIGGVCDDTLPGNCTYLDNQGAENTMSAPGRYVYP